MSQPDDVASIAQAMQAALAESPAERTRRHERGVARAREFTWQRSAQALLAVYRQLLTRP